MKLITSLLFLFLLIYQNAICQDDSLTYKEILDNLKIELSEEGFDTTNIFNTKTKRLLDKFIPLHFVNFLSNDFYEKRGKTRKFKKSDFEKVITIDDWIKVIQKDLYNIKEESNITPLAKVLNNLANIISISESSLELVKKDNERLPARVLYINNNLDNNKNEIFIVDGIIKLDLGNFFSIHNLGNEYLKFKLGPFIEYHRYETDQNDSTNILSFGASEVASALIERNLNTSMNLEFSEALSRDYIKENNFLKFSSYIYFSFEPYKYKFLRYILPSNELYGIKIGSTDFEIISWYYKPLFGVEALSNVKINVDKSDIIYRLIRFNAEINLIQRLFSCNLDWQFRKIIEHSGPVEDIYSNFFQASLNLNLIGNIALSLQGINPNIKVALGFDYKEGANPWISFKNQIRREIAFKLKF